MKAPAKSFPTDTPAWSAIMTSMMLGGIRMLRTPPAATVPQAMRLSYPWSSMTGTAISVMLTTLAPMMPVQAASMAHITITARAMPPFTGPNRYIMPVKRPAEISDWDRNAAIRTNRGMASRMLLVVESKARPKNRYHPEGPQPKKAKMAAVPPSTRATGWPRKSPAMTTANIANR